MTDENLSYEQAGVNIAEGNEFVKDLGQIIKRSWRTGVMNGIGGFAGFFDLKACGFEDPLLLLPPMAWAPKLSWRAAPTFIMALALTLWRCVQMTLWSMVVNRSSSWIISPQANWTAPIILRSLNQWSKAAGTLDVR